MSFEQRKAAMLASLASSVTDKSPKGTLDARIVPLLHVINSHPDFFTTSSCSGRISVFSHPTNRPKGGAWLFITHDPADASALLPFLFPAAAADDDDDDDVSTTPHQLVFRFEPLIVAVECRDVESAQRLVSLAVASGLRESGVTSVKRRVIVGIRCSIRLEVPLGESGGVLVSEEYVRFLVGVANEKMEANRRRTDGFLQALLGSDGFTSPAVEFTGENGIENGENGSVDDDDSKKVDGPAGAPSCCSLPVTQMVIAGEPVEKLFLWGHSACTLRNKDNDYKVLVYGGFGGMGRHSRRNDTLLLDPLQGTLEAVHTEGSPSPRLGHTSSLVGNRMFVIGGRADPLNILSDVWVFNVDENDWRLLECTGGSAFPPRHRHAAAVVGSKIYVFGGVNNNAISSSLHVLDTDNKQWKELSVSGEWPCARHSHSMVAYGSQIYMFGGHSGEKVLGDLYSFDVHTCLWKKEEVAGKSPHARFSHSMFLYKNYLGVIGGCPVGQHGQVLALLDLQLRTWKYLKLNSMIKELLVRCTANVVGDDLVMIGGGAACYAFGTKFSEPMKINLLPLAVMCRGDWHVPSEPSKIGIKFVSDQPEGVTREKNINFEGPQIGNAPSSTQDSGTEPNGVNGGHQMVASHWVVQLDRKYAKLGKDILKKFGWLDLGRKAYPQEDGIHICFPVTEKFCAVFNEKQHNFGDESEALNNFRLSKPFTGEGMLLNEISSSTALHLLKECGATKLADKVVEVRRASKSPLKTMTEAVASLVQHKGLSATLLEQLPSRWERLGDIVVLPVTAFKDPVWDSIGDELWPIIAKSLNASRLACQGRVAPTGTRDSTLEILVGDNGWVNHCENGILYSFDATKCMFSWGNLSEKLRMARLDCTNEVIVDLFAGIGYFVMPFLVRAKAKLVYACEWNPHAVEALQHNLQANSVSDRCIVLEGDNRVTAPKGVADRVCLGLIPSSENSWVTAVRALRTEGGMLHLHGNVKDSEEGQWAEHVSRSISEIARSEGKCWEVTIEHVERVKWYAPHIRHLVADVRCRQIQR